METFLLNPNVPAPNPETPQAISPVQDEGDGEFSPLLDEAITSIDQDDNPQELSEEIENNSFNLAANLGANDREIEPFLPNETSFIANEFVPTGQVALSVSETIVTSELSVQTQMSASVVTAGGNLPVLQQQESPLSVAQPGMTNEPGAPTQVENILLQQIQQILDQNSNKGTIVISGTGETISTDMDEMANLQNLSNPLVTDIENGEIQSRQVGVPLSPIEEISTAAQKTTKLDSSRQDVSEQYLSAKLDKSSNDGGEQFQNNNSEQKGTEQQDKNSTQIANQTTTTTAPEAKPGESAFGQQLTLNTSTTTQTTSVEGKFSPGAELPVPEKEIVNNLIQRFNVNPRLQTSKLTMQLHPAELGALKIDILVNNDSIKANIVAQSQQVLETLEKHMPRLKTILENQGFSVDAFEITMEGDSSNQSELFQEQFQSQQQSEFTSSNSSLSSKTDSFEALLNSQEDAEDSDEEESGVNVKA